jgi:hypothetical protein
MITVGMTACGKTHYLVQELKTTFFHQFENIFLICSTFTGIGPRTRISFMRMKVSLSFPTDRTMLRSILSLSWISRRERNPQSSSTTERAG